MNTKIKKNIIETKDPKIANATGATFFKHYSLLQGTFSSE
jgi:hypothetical protein